MCDTNYIEQNLPTGNAGGLKVPPASRIIVWQSNQDHCCVIFVPFGLMGIESKGNALGTLSVSAQQKQSVAEPHMREQLPPLPFPAPPPLIPPQD